MTTIPSFLILFLCLDIWDLLFSYNHKELITIIIIFDLLLMFFPSSINTILWLLLKCYFWLLLKYELFNKL